MTKAKFLVQVEVRGYLDITTVSIVNILKDLNYAGVKVYRLDKPADYKPVDEKSETSAKHRFAKKMKLEGKEFAILLENFDLVLKEPSTGGGLFGDFAKEPPHDLNYKCPGCGSGDEMIHSAFCPEKEKVRNVRKVDTPPKV